MTQAWHEYFAVPIKVANQICPELFTNPNN